MRIKWGNNSSWIKMADSWKYPGKCHGIGSCQHTRCVLLFSTVRDQGISKKQKDFILDFRFYFFETELCSSNTDLLYLWNCCCYLETCVGIPILEWFSYLAESGKGSGIYQFSGSGLLNPIYSTGYCIINWPWITDCLLEQACTRVINLGSDTFDNPIFQKGLQN